MDVNDFRKHAIPQIEAGRKIDAIRQAIKSERYADQDKRESFKETFKPVTDKLEEEIGELTDEIKDLKMLPAPHHPAIEGPIIRELERPEEGPIIRELKEATEKLRSIAIDPDKGFTAEELELIRERKLPTPLGIFESGDERTLEKAVIGIAKRRSKIYAENRKKGTTEDRKEALTKELGVLTKYKKRVSEVERGLTLRKGSGIYARGAGRSAAFTQPKRNAYKISKNGEYGRLMIDLPRLLGHLQLVATKDGKKVFDKIADLDTIDLLTKRFNGKKKYSPLSRSVFDELNTLGELPIHKTSKKFSKIGSGVVYFKDPEDLSDRLELLGGSIKSGNDSARNEFSAVAHALHRLGEITTDQLKGLLGKYLSLRPG